MRIWFLSPSIIRYGELQKITEAAAAAGLLAPKTSPLRLRIVAKEVEKPPFDFSTGAPGDEQYSDLALRAFGVELERRLRILARRIGLTSVVASKRLLRHLLRSGTLSPQEYNLLGDLVAILDRVEKGAGVETAAAEWSVDIGSRLLAALEQHLIPPDLSEFGL